MSNRSVPENVGSASTFVSGAVYTAAATHTEDEADPSRSTCDCSKVLAVVRRKMEQTVRAYQFVRYLIFSGLSLYVVWLQRDAEPACSLQIGLKDYFMGGYRDPNTLEIKNFMSISTVDEFWDWHMYAFCPDLIYVQDLANGEPMTSEINTMMQHNRLTSGFRMTQRRGKPSTCPIQKKWWVFAPTCTQRTYVEGLVGAVDKNPFTGALPDDPANPPVYVYEEVDLGVGMKDTGYFQIFGGDPSECARIPELKRQRWINTHTQYYRLDFVVYNPNVGLFTSINFKIVFDNSGVLIPEYYAETLSSTIYTSWTDMVRLGLEIGVVIWWTIIMTVCMIRARTIAKQEKRWMAYFDETINIFVCVQLILIGAIFIIWGLMATNPIRDGLIVTGDSIRTTEGRMPNFQGLVAMSQLYFILCGINCLIILTVILSFMRINANLSQLTDTISFMLRDLMQFLVILVLLIVAFMLMAHSLFGNTLEEFADLGRCFVSVFEFLMGSGDYFELAEADPVAAPLFFFPFVFVMLFVTLNITIAIIMDGYTAMQDNRKIAKEGFFAEMTILPFHDQVFHGFLRLFSFANRYFPQKWSEIKSHNGRIVDRFECASGQEIINLFSDIEEEVENQLIPFDQLLRLLRHKPISPERLAGIFDRYNAWGSANDGSAAEYAATFSEQLLPDLTSLNNLVATIQNEQKVLENKIEHIIMAFPT